jgi:hypothetical protein
VKTSNLTNSEIIFAIKITKRGPQQWKESAVISVYNFRFSQRRLQTVLYSGTHRFAVREIFTDFSEEHVASIFRVKE